MIRRASQLRRTPRPHATRRRLHRAGASRVGAGLLRHCRDRNHGESGERRPPPRQGPSVGSHGRYRRRHRHLSQGADA